MPLFQISTSTGDTTQGNGKVTTAKLPKSKTHSGFLPIAGFEGQTL